MRSAAWYSRFAKATAQFCGRPPIFSLAVAIIAVWLVTGPLFGFSDTWQLVINTGTTIITFLMVFLIQNTQNRDTEAIQIKLDDSREVSGAGRRCEAGTEPRDSGYRDARAMSSVCAAVDIQRS